MGVRLIMGPKDAHVLLLGTCEYVPSHEERDLADVTKLKNSKWGGDPGISGWVQYNPRILRGEARDGGGSQSQRRKQHKSKKIPSCWLGRRKKEPQAKKCRRLLEGEPQILPPKKRSPANPLTWAQWCGCGASDLHTGRSPVSVVLGPRVCGTLWQPPWEPEAVCSRSKSVSWSFGPRTISLSNFQNAHHIRNIKCHLGFKRRANWVRTVLLGKCVTSLPTPSS